MKRICVTLYYYDEKSVAEIAELFECSEGTVKSRLNYARKKIKEELEAIEKRDNIKLHSAAIIPLLGVILSGQMPAVPHPPLADILNGPVGAAAPSLKKQEKLLKILLTVFLLLQKNHFQRTC